MLSAAPVYGMMPSCSTMALEASGSETSQTMKSIVACLSSSEALSLMAQRFSVPQLRPAFSSPFTPQ